MPINMKKYVDIKSGINNIRTATEKELIARIFTKSASLANEVVECETLADVGSIFATSSDEYKIASKYFSFVNKYARSPRKISFAKDGSDGAYASVTGSVKMTTSADLNALRDFFTDKTLTVTINGVGTDLAISIETAVYTTINSILTQIKNAINTALSTAEINITCSVAGTTDEGWLSFTADAKANETISLSGEGAELLKVSANYNPDVVTGFVEGDYNAVFDRSYQVNNNFATFVFLSLTDEDDIATLADHVKSNYPSEFIMIVPVTTATYTAIQAEVATIDAVSLELCGSTEDEGKFNFVLPMAITATTDYNKENGTVNYMYTQDSNMKVVVDDDTTADTYDSLKINYYGRTQQAGQKLAFYQNGVLQGNYQDQNIYINEVWLKDALATKFLNYMLLTSNWYANKGGQAIGQGLVIDVIERAKLNGTITTEKEISENDKVYIYNVTADENAWRQIYEQGYYLITSIEKVTVNNQTTYKFNYTLIYSKGDSIKKVEGYNILI